MKHTLIFIVLAIFFSQVSVFLFRNETPWNKEKLNAELEEREITTNTQTIEFINETIELGLIMDYLKLDSLAALLVFIGATLTCTVAAIHTFFDKLFFKKFYENSDWQLAVRRGIMSSVGLIGLIVLRLMAGLTWYTGTPFLILIALIEYLLTNRERGYNQPLLNEEQEIHEKPTERVA